MTLIKIIKGALFIVPVSILVAACGGGSTNNTKDAIVSNLFTDAASVQVGDDIDLDVDFTFSHDIVVNDNHNVIVIVRVPNGLRYELDTARVDEVGGTDSVDPTVEICSNGDSYLRFSLGQDVLNNASDPSGTADGKLIMALLGSQSVGAVTIDAVAGYDFDLVSGSCSVGIFAQESAAFTVL